MIPDLTSDFMPEPTQKTGRIGSGPGVRSTLKRGLPTNSTSPKWRAEMQPTQEPFSDATHIPQVAVHCFFCMRCGIVIRDVDHRTAHERMEAHYAEKHTADLDRIVFGGSR